MPVRRGVPRMSPALLSKRLKELETHGVLERVLLQKIPEIFEYRLTKAGDEVRTVVEAIGIWGHRWVETNPSLENVDPKLLMWDMRRNLNVEPLPARRIIIQFVYPELPRAQRNYWLLIDPAHGADLCSVDPGFDAAELLTFGLGLPEGRYDTEPRRRVVHCRCPAAG